MRQIIIFLFVILHCLFRANASSHPGTGDFSLSTTRFYQKGDSIFLQCRITGNAPIGKWQSYVVDCCLRNNDSLDRLDSFGCPVDIIIYTVCGKNKNQSA